MFILFLLEQFIHNLLLLRILVQSNAVKIVRFDSFLWRKLLMASVNYKSRCINTFIWLQCERTSTYPIFTYGRCLLLHLMAEPLPSYRCDFVAFQTHFSDVDDDSFNSLSFRIERSAMLIYNASRNKLHQKKAVQEKKQRNAKSTRKKNN